VVPAVAHLKRAALAVVGCGNLNRRDDAAGVRVVAQLRARYASTGVPPGVQLFDAGTAGMEVMFQARGARALAIVDACRSGSEAGAIFRLPGAEVGTRGYDRGYSLHDFRWDHALHAGRRIFGDDFPDDDDVEVWLIEAGSLALGIDVTAPVARAIDEVARRIGERIDVLVRS
jgi:hydrogenase maturation protease